MYRQMGMPNSKSALASAMVFVLVCVMVFATTAMDASAQNRLALVIGNDTYKNVAPLKKAANDAQGIGETLKDLGFSVTIATNLNRREMNLAIQTFNGNIKENDTALLFFAGHGVEIDGENFLLPIDVPNAKSNQLGFIREESIRLNTVLSDLKARKANLNLVILDACRNNPFSGPAGRSLGGGAGLARISAPQGTFVMYSADVGETALDRLSDDDANPNSVFTRTLIPLMKTPGIDLVDTARETRRQVRKLALSVSHDQTPAYYDAVLGDFYFTPPNTEVPKAPAKEQVEDVTPVEKPVDQDTQVTSLGDAATNGKDLNADKQPQVTVDLPAMVVTAGEKDLIRVWDAEKFSLLAELTGEKKLFSSVRLTHNGQSVMVAGQDGSVVTYSLPTFKKRSVFYPEFAVSALAQTKDGTILVGGENGILAAYDGKTLRENWRRQAHDDIVSPIVLGQGQVITASGDGAVVVTDIVSGKEIVRTQTFAGGKITDIAFVDASTVVASHEGGEIAYINLATKRVLLVFKAHDGWISSVDVTPDNSGVVTAGVNGNLKYWRLGTKELIKTVRAHSDVAAGAKFFSALDSDRLASVGFDGILRFWRKNGGGKLAELEHGPAILHFDYTQSR